MKTTAMVMLTAALTGLQVTGTDVQAQDRKFKEAITVQGTVRKGVGDYMLTFSGPVALPGVSLAAGTYVFRQPVGNVIQVSNAAGMPYAMFSTIPTVREAPLDEVPGSCSGRQRRRVRPSASLPCSPLGSGPDSSSSIREDTDLHGSGGPGPPDLIRRFADARRSQDSGRVQVTGRHSSVSRASFRLTFAPSEVTPTVGQRAATQEVS